jgi:hypothetical protein
MDFNQALNNNRTKLHLCKPRKNSDMRHIGVYAYIFAKMNIYIVEKGMVVIQAALLK